MNTAPAGELGLKMTWPDGCEEEKKKREEEKLKKEEEAGMGEFG